jgi:hypothetical protein
MTTVNEKLAEASISHSINLQHYSNGIVRRLIALLNRVDSDLFAQITASLERLPAESFTAKRLDALLVSVRELNREAYISIERELTPELKALVQYEAGYQLQLFAATIPAPVVAQLAIGAVDIERTYTAAMSRPFQGRLLSEWMAGLEEGRAVRIRDAIRIGYTESQTVSQIVQRLRGTKAKGYSDGIIEIDRRNAESVARTAISHMAGSTRDGFYEKNNDLIKAVQWVSTLDSRTTHICMVRDGKKYTNDTHKPIGHSLPWLGGAGRAHWGCRSSTVPVIRSFKDLGIDLPEFDEGGTRSSMDGQVSSGLTYPQWLQKQSVARQIEVLGKTRAKLMRDGGLTVDKFTNDRGRWLNLDELRQRDSAAFKRAGLQ